MLYASDRYFTFPAFANTAKILHKRLNESGLSSIETSAAPADGRSQAGFWTMPLAWDATVATLDVVSPVKLNLCDYPKIPTCLGMWSGPTPAQGIEAELVDLDTAKWSALKGKLVLTSQNSADLKAKLVQAGALGAVNGFSENPELRDDRQWINAWGDHGWAFTSTSTPLLSFSVTPSQAEQLRKLLAKGTVRVRAKAATKYYEGKYPWITAVIPGTHPDEEVLALAHTSEQGAQDNATGVAASIEALHTLRTLIEAGQLRKPRRSIRVLLMPEMHGSLHYIEASRKRMTATVASITVDTPAASYDLAGTEYTIYRSPHVGRSWVDVLMPQVAQSLLPARRPWHLSEHMTGTDAYLAEPTVGVPNVWLYSGTGVVTHHNSADIPSTVDKRSMSDLIGLVASYLYYSANAGEAESPWLAAMIVDLACQELTMNASSGVSAALAGDRNMAAFLASRLDYIADRNEGALESLRRIGGSDALIAAQSRIMREFAAVQKQRLAPLQLEPYQSSYKTGTKIVRRKRIGTIPLDDLATEQREGFPSGAWNRMVTFALYWCDGKRTIAEAARLTEMEMGRPLTFDFESYFRFLERHGYVEFAN